MCCFTLFISVDPYLGRVDYSLLSDQTLMEMLLEGFDDETKKTYKDNDGMYLDICEWLGIEFDDDGGVIQIYIDSHTINGSLKLCYVPPKVNVLMINSWGKNQLRGSVDLTQLPCGMEELYLYNNQLTGVVDLTQLPSSMETLGLHNNQLTGVVDLTQLPGEMTILWLHNNQLTGAIDLTHLPERMESLYLRNNQLSGAIDLTQLPGEMKTLWLNNNQLSGEIDLTQLPGEMKTL